MTAWSLASWSWEPSVLIGLFAMIGAYIVGLRRFQPRTLWGEQVVSLRELFCFGAGVFFLVVALVSPLDTLSDALFVAHMFQHMLLVYVVPPLLLLGMPAWLLRPALRLPGVEPALRFVTSFVPATIVFNLALIVWHMPAAWDLALLSRPVHALEHLTFLGAALISWWPICSPLPEIPRLSYAGQMLFLFVQSLVPAVIGAFLTFSGMVIYPVYLETPKLLGLTPLTDQQWAGLEMKLLGTVFLWVLLTVRFFQWFSHEEHQDEKLIDDSDRG